MRLSTQTTRSPARAVSRTASTRALGVQAGAAHVLLAAVDHHERRPAPPARRPGRATPRGPGRPSGPRATGTATPAGRARRPGGPVPPPPRGRARWARTRSGGLRRARPTPPPRPARATGRTPHPGPRPPWPPPRRRRSPTASGPPTPRPGAGPGRPGPRPRPRGAPPAPGPGAAAAMATDTASAVGGTSTTCAPGPRANASAARTSASPPVAARTLTDGSDPTRGRARPTGAGGEPAGPPPGGPPAQVDHARIGTDARDTWAMGARLHPGRRRGVVVDHPPRHPTAVQRDADHGPDAHPVPEGVGDRVVEGAVDGGDVGQDPGDPAHPGQRPSCDVSASTRSVRSQVKPSPVRPKWP